MLKKKSINIWNFLFIISSIFFIGCNDNSDGPMAFVKEVDSIDLVYLDSLNNSKLIKRVVSKDSISVIMKIIKDSKQEYLKINCEYNLKINSKDTSYLVLLNNEYIKYSGIVYKLDSNLLSFILAKNVVNSLVADL